MLALKVALVPLFLAAISLAGSRWGPSVAGWLAGLPVVAGPILAFIAYDHGAGFAATAAAAALAAVLASVAFNLVYAHACLRFHYLLSLVLALLAWCSAVALLALLPKSSFISLGIACSTLFVASHLFPVGEASESSAVLPRSEIAIRMIAGALLTLFVTTLAAVVGPSWSGLFAVFPVLGSVLAVFSQRAHGPTYAIELLRGMVRGLYSFTAFCFSLSIALSLASVPLSFVVSVIAALLAQWLSKAYGISRSKARSDSLLSNEAA